MQRKNIVVLPDGKRRAELFKVCQSLMALKWQHGQFSYFKTKCLSYYCDPKTQKVVMKKSGPIERLKVEPTDFFKVG